MKLGSEVLEVNVIVLFTWLSYYNNDKGKKLNLEYRLLVVYGWSNDIEFGRD